MNNRTDLKTIGAIHAVADALIENMQNVSTKDDEHLAQMNGLIDALHILRETIE